MYLLGKRKILKTHGIYKTINEILRTEKNILDHDGYQSCLRFAQLSLILHDSYRLVYDNHSSVCGFCYSMRYAQRCIRKDLLIRKDSEAIWSMSWRISDRQK